MPITLEQATQLMASDLRLPWWMREDGIEKAVAACRRAGVPSLVIGGGSSQLSIVLGEDPGTRPDQEKPIDERPSVDDQFAASGQAPARDPGFAEE